MTDAQTQTQILEEQQPISVIKSADRHGNLCITKYYEPSDKYPANDIVMHPGGFINVHIEETIILQNN